RDRGRDVLSGTRLHRERSRRVCPSGLRGRRSHSAHAPYRHPSMATQRGDPRGDIALTWAGVTTGASLRTFLPSVNIARGAAHRSREETLPTRATSADRRTCRV